MKQILWSVYFSYLNFCFPTHNTYNIYDIWEFLIGAISIMGRKRKNQICPACGKLGRVMSKWTWNGDYTDAPATYSRYFRHYKTETGRKPSDCYIEDILLKEDFKHVSAMPYGELVWKNIKVLRRIRNYYHRISDMVNKTKYPSTADPFDFEMLSKSMDLGLFRLDLENMSLHLSHLKRMAGDEENHKLNEFKTKLNETRTKMEGDMAFIFTYIPEAKLSSIIDKIGDTYKNTYHKLKSKQGQYNRKYLENRCISLTNRLQSAPKYQIPFMLAFENWFLTYKFPELLKKKKEFSKVLKNSHFGNRKDSVTPYNSN